METGIYIFDVDDTLIDTRACIRAVDESGQIIFRAGTKEFNNPKNAEQLLLPGLRWDFTEFESLEQICSEPTLPAFDVLKEVIKNKNNSVHIITARQSIWMLHDWLWANGIPIEYSHIHCYDRDAGETVAQFKARTLTGIYEGSTYNDVYIYEDDELNANAMIDVSGSHNIALNRIFR